MLCNVLMLGKCGIHMIFHVIAVAAARVKCVYVLTFVFSSPLQSILLSSPHHHCTYDRSNDDTHTHIFSGSLQSHLLWWFSSIDFRSKFIKSLIVSGSNCLVVIVIGRFWVFLISVRSFVCGLFTICEVSFCLCLICMVCMRAFVCMMAIIWNDWRQAIINCLLDVANN